MDIPMVINESSQMNGVFVFKNKARVEGMITGIIDSSSDLIISQTGCIRGVLRTKDLVVYGKLEGSIVAMGTTKFCSGSSFLGNLYTRVINVEEGAVVQAKIMVGDKSELYHEPLMDLADDNLRLQAKNWTDIPSLITQNADEGIFNILESNKEPPVILQREQEKTLQEQTETLSSEVFSKNTIEPSLFSPVIEDPLKDLQSFSINTPATLINNYTVGPDRPAGVPPEETKMKSQEPGHPDIDEFSTILKSEKKSRIRTIKKPKGKINNKSKEVPENEISNNSTEPQGKGSFLNDSLARIPETDYSYLFK